MKRLDINRKISPLSFLRKVLPEKEGQVTESKTEKFKFPKVNFNFKMLFKIFLGFLGVILILLVISYFVVLRPVLAMASNAKELKVSLGHINKGLKDLNFQEIKDGLTDTKVKISDFEAAYEKNMRVIRKLPKAENYYQDGMHLLRVANDGIELGELVVGILEPYANDLGFATDGKPSASVPAQDRIVKLLRLMPEFSPEVSEISDKMNGINSELEKIDASRYPKSLPGIVKTFGIDPNLDVRGQILALQSVSDELAKKAPEFEAMFNAIPEFMGLNEPKRYLILMANNYELRMSGGFNTYALVVEFSEGIPEIIYSIDTYFIDEGDRTGSSALVDKNPSYFLRNYLYLSGNTYRLYARDATSEYPDFPRAADNFYSRFWQKDYTFPQELSGVIQINNDVAVNVLDVVGPVSTEKYSIKTDQGNYITIPVTEFNSDNVIAELENIAGGKLAQTIGRKEIIRFLGQSIFEKIFTSEATNLVNLANVMLDSMSSKDIILYSFDPEVERAFVNLGYGGKLDTIPEGWDYLHVNRSNFGSGKADWTKEGFVTQEVEKDVEVVDGKKISTVKVTIKNPKRPNWYDIDPCCFYRGFVRLYVPLGSKMISVTADDGQDVHAAELVDEDVQKTVIESFTVQQKETDLTITYVYELPDSVNLDDYNILLQKQPGATADPYKVTVNGKSSEVLLNSDTVITL